MAVKALTDLGQAQTWRVRREGKELRLVVPAS